MAEEIKIVISADASDAQKTLAELLKKLQKVGKGADDAANKHFAAFEGRLKRIGSKAVDFGKQTDYMRTRTSKLGAAVAKVGNKLAKWGPLIAGGAFIAAARSFIKTQSEIELKLANVATIADQSQLSLRKIDEGIMKIARGSARETTELIDGFYQAISAGIPQVEGAGGAFEFLELAQKAATAGMSTVAEAVDAGTTAFNVFGVDAKQSFDKLQATIRDGKTTMPELARNMGQAATVAKKAGLSFDELLASVAQLTKGGVKTADAFTAIRGAAQALASPTQDIRKRLTDMGLSMDKVSGDAVKRDGFLTVLNRIFTATGGNLEEMRKVIPEIEGMKAALVLGGEGAKGYADQLDRIANSSGVMAKAAAEAEGAVKNQVTTLSNAFDSLGRVLFRTLGPALAGFLKNTTAEVNNLARGVDVLARAFQRVYGGMTDAELQSRGLTRVRGAGIGAKGVAPFRFGPEGDEPAPGSFGVLATAAERAAGDAAAKANAKAARGRRRSGKSRGLTESDLSRLEGGLEFDVRGPKSSTGIGAVGAAALENQETASAALAAGSAASARLSAMNAPGVAAQALSAAGNFAADALMSAGRQVLDLLSLAPEEFGLALADLLEGFKQQIMNIMANLPNLVRLLPDMIRDIGRQILNSLPEFAKQMIAALIAEAPDLFGAMAVELSAGLIAKMPEIIKGLAEGVAKGLEDLFTGKGMVKGIPIIGDLVGGIGDIFGFAQGGIVPSIQRFAGGGIVEQIARATGGGQLSITHPDEAVITAGTWAKVEDALVNAVRAGTQGGGGGGGGVITIETDGRSPVLDAAIETSRLRYMRRQGIPVRTSRDTLSRGIPALSRARGARG